jgi:hypothetical protein
VVKVPHVAEVRADVTSRRKGVLVSLDLQVDPDANLATVTDEACQTAQEVLTERVHVHLLRPPSARLHYRELRLHRGSDNAPQRRAPVPAVAGAQAGGGSGGMTESRGGVAVAEPPAAPDLSEHVMRGDDDETLPAGELSPEGKTT